MPKPLKFAFAAAVVLVLGLSAQNTVAAWRAEGQVDAGSIKTGSLSLLAGSGTESGKDYVFRELQTQNLLPGSFVQAPLTISNAGTTPLAYGLTGITTGTDSASAKDKALAAAARVAIYADVPPGSCTGTQQVTGQLLYSGSLAAGASFASPRGLSAAGTAGASELLCVRLSLPSGAAQSAAGGRMTPTLSFTGQQK